MRQETCAKGTIVLALLAGLAFVPAGHADSEETPDPIQVVLLGVSHFAGSSGDDFTHAIEDILSDERQAELDEAADRLADFDPDQAFFECMPGDQVALNGQYRKYLSGDYDPVEAGRRGEIRQLGFRLGRAAGIDSIQCADARGLWLGSQARMVGARHNPEIIESIQKRGKASIRRNAEFLEDHDMVAYLRYLNREEQLFDNHSAYILDYVRVGSFNGAGLKTHMETELAGSEVVFAGGFGGYPVERVRSELEPAGVRVAENLSESTDYLVAGEGAAEARQEADELGVTVMGMKEFVAHALQRSEVYVGFPEHHVGADLVGEFYKRNLRIYANIWNAVEPGTERIFVMFGQGHIWTLRQFLRENPAFEVVPASEYL